MTHRLFCLNPTLPSDGNTMDGKSLKEEAVRKLREQIASIGNDKAASNIAGYPSQKEAKGRPPMNGAPDDAILVGCKETGDIAVYTQDGKEVETCSCGCVIDRINAETAEVIAVRTVTFIVYKNSPAKICFLDSGRLICV